MIAVELAAQVFGAAYAEVRVGSGALANLYAFMATCAPGDRIIAPPATIGGHVTRHREGAAGLYGLQTIEAPVDADRFTVDIDALRTLARQSSPTLITVGGSLNLRPHPVADVRAIADEGGQHAARALRAHANLLTCGIGLPIAPVTGDLNGLRLGTPEAVRIGMTAAEMPLLAGFITRGLAGDGSVADEVTEWRSGFTGVHYTLDSPAP